MRKVLLGLLLSLGMFVTSVSVASAKEATGYRVIIEDDADLLTDTEETSLAEVMKGITAYGNVAFKSISTNSMSSRNYAENYYRSKFGTASGTVFLVDMDNRNLWIFSDGAIYRVITKGYADTITDNVYTKASAADYYGCAAEAFRQMNKLLEGDKIAQPMKYASNAFLAVIAALLINFGVVTVFAGTRKTTDKELMSKAEKRFAITKPVPTFLHETKVYDPVSDSGGSSGSSGGGGGGSSGGGGGHSF